MVRACCVCVIITDNQKVHADNLRSFVSLSICTVMRGTRRFALQRGSFGCDDWRVVVVVVAEATPSSRGHRGPHFLSGL